MSTFQGVSWERRACTFCFIFFPDQEAQFPDTSWESGRAGDPVQGCLLRCAPSSYATAGAGAGRGAAASLLPSLSPARRRCLPSGAPPSCSARLSSGRPGLQVSPAPSREPPAAPRRGSDGRQWAVLEGRGGEGRTRDHPPQKWGSQENVGLHLKRGPASLEERRTEPKKRIRTPHPTQKM